MMQNNTTSSSVLCSTPRAPAAADDDDDVFGHPHFLKESKQTAIWFFNNTGENINDDNDGRNSFLKGHWQAVLEKNN